MLYVVHGENSVGQRNFVVAQKTAGSHLVEVLSVDISPAELASRYLTSDLFGIKSVFVLNISGDKSFDYASFFTAVADKKSPNDLIFYNEGFLPKSSTLLKPNPKSPVEIKEFKEEFKGSIFSFLDAVLERRKKDAYREYSNLTEKKEGEFEIFSMLIGGARNIAYVVCSSRALEKLHPYVKTKIQKQGIGYGRKKLEEIYKLLYTFDLQLKTGKITPDVAIPLLIEKIAS